MDKIVITLTFDDGLDVHLDSVMPLLDRNNLKASFYVPLSADCFHRRTNEWRQAAASGHELGNHTIFHPAVRSKKWVREGNAIENYSLDRMRMELEVANNILEMLDGKKERTFAFPCSYPVVGRPGLLKRTLRSLKLDRTRLMGWVDKWDLDFGSGEKNYTDVVRELFFAARCGGLPIESLPSIPLDKYQVRGVEGDGCSAEGLLSSVDQAIERRLWLVFVFHGIGGGHRLSCSLDAFGGLVKRLASDNRIIVKTFLDAARDIWG
ncbi:MAG: polysaccharide deacetylase family protein [Thermodesulfovibrionales bacterium]